MSGGECLLPTALSTRALLLVNLLSDMCVRVSPMPLTDKSASVDIASVWVPIPLFECCRVCDMHEVCLFSALHPQGQDIPRSWLTWGARRGPQTLPEGPAPPEFSSREEGRKGMIQLLVEGPSMGLTDPGTHMGGQREGLRPPYRGKRLTDLGKHRERGMWG